MSKRKLLLADDSVTIQKVVNLTFADEGIEVVTVGNGSAAIEKLSEIEPDLVLADVHMPGLTGYEVCEQIRQTAAYKDIPVMLLVGSFEPFDEVKARSVGANDYLTKPFQSIRQLVQKVTSLLNSVDSNNSAADSSTTAERSTNLGDDEMIETVPGSNFDTNNNFVFSAPTEQNRAVSTTDNQFESANLEYEDQDTRPTAPLSFVDIQEINSFSSIPSPTLENESVSSESNFYYQENSTEPLMNFASPDYIEEEQSDVFELDLSSTADSPNSQSVTPNFGSYQSDEISLVNEPDENSIRNEPVSFETSDNYFSSSLANNENDSNYNRSNSGSEPTIEFSDSSILELDTADSAPIASQDEDSILDLELESADTTSDFAAGTEFDFQPETVETNNNDSTAAFESTPSQTTGQAQTEQVSRSTVDNMIAQASASAISDMNLPYSPEMIDAIAQKVVEKLSDKVIERIAWEIVPDKLDSLMRQYIENRNR